MPQPEFGSAGTRAAHSLIFHARLSRVQFARKLRGRRCTCNSTQPSHEGRKAAWSSTNFAPAWKERGRRRAPACCNEGLIDSDASKKDSAAITSVGIDSRTAAYWPAPIGGKAGGGQTRRSNGTTRRDETRSESLDFNVYALDASTGE